MDGTSWMIVIALVGSVLSCFFAACNVALKRFSRSRLLELMEERGCADACSAFVDRTHRLMLLTGAARAALVLVVFLAAHAYLAHRFPRWETWVVYAAAFVAAGLLVSVFSVAIPMSWGRYQPERLLAGSRFILTVMLVALNPLVSLLHAVDPVVRRLIGVDAEGDSESQISDDVLSVVETHEEAHTVDPTQKQMIEAVFEFPTTTAGEIMTPRTDVYGIDAAASLEQIKAFVLEHGHSRVPVYEETIDNIVGILYAKDLLEFIHNDKPFDLRQVMRDALMVPESKSVRELLGEFKGRKVHIAVVLDEYGGTAGIVTIEDILEELVGEIEDEYESEEEAPPIRRIDDSAADVDARMHIDDLNDEMKLDLPEDEDYDTIGGFVFSSLGHIPEVGEAFEAEGVRFTVLGAERTRVTRVRVQKLAPEPAARNGNGRTTRNGH